jgi:hypothetical protein
MKRGRALGFFAAVVFFAGCSKPPSEKDIVGSMISWMGTGDMAAQAWLNHTTFDRFTRETLELSSKMLDDQASQLKEVAPSHSASLDSAVSRARSAMAEIGNLIAANDAPDIPAKLDSLRAAKKIVLAAGDSLEKQQ